MKIIVCLVILLSLTLNVFSGPLAPGIWTAVAIKAAIACSYLGPGTPAYLACVAAYWVAYGPASSLFCFSPDTTVASRNGVIPIANVQHGDEIKTLVDGKERWTEVLYKEVTHQELPFIRISTRNQSVEVTPEHVMIVENKLIQAKDIKIGMNIQGQQIETLSRVLKGGKITLLTRQGTLLANGIWTTSICGDYLAAKGNELSVIEEWKKQHKWLL